MARPPTEANPGNSHQSSSSCLCGCVFCGVFFGGGYLYSLFCGKSSDSPPKQTQGTATNPCLIQVWSGPGQSIRTAFSLHYCQIRAAEHPKCPFSWDEGDGTGEPRLLARSSEVSKASTSVEQNRLIAVSQFRCRHDLSYVDLIV